MADEVLTSRDGAVLTITFNRPEVYNAFNRELHAALHEALDEANDPAVRCVVITGAGKGFCAGQDLKEFGDVSGVHRATRSRRPTTRTSASSARSRSR